MGLKQFCNKWLFCNPWKIRLFFIWSFLDIIRRARPGGDSQGDQTNAENPRGRPATDNVHSVLNRKRLSSPMWARKFIESKMNTVAQLCWNTRSFSTTWNNGEDKPTWIEVKSIHVGFVSVQWEIITAKDCTVCTERNLVQVLLLYYKTRLCFFPSCHLPKNSLHNVISLS